jgi:hypothetical protein
MLAGAETGPFRRRWKNRGATPAETLQRKALRCNGTVGIKKRSKANPVIGEQHLPRFPKSANELAAAIYRFVDGKIVDD